MKTKKQRLNKNLNALIEPMSPQARQLLLDDLVPKFTSGEIAEVLDDLYRDDFLWKPVDVRTFLHDPKFLGKDVGAATYPKIVDDLEELFAGQYSEVILAGGIGWGKTRMAELGILYDIYLLSCLRNPAENYRLMPGSTLAFLNISVTQAQAKRILFGGLLDLVRHSPYFCKHFPFDLKIGTELRFPRNITCYPVASNEHSMLGENVYSAAFDEMNFMPLVEHSKQQPDGGMYDSAQVLYDRLSRRIRSRMHQRGRLPGHLWLISSARYPGDFTERKIFEAISDPHIFVRRYATWETRPRSFFMPGTFRVEIGDTGRRTRVLSGNETNVMGTVLDIPLYYKPEFDNDPEKSLMELAGIAILAIKPFIGQPEKIQAMFARGEGVGLRHAYSHFTVTLQDTRQILLPDLLHWVTFEENVNEGTVEHKKLADGPYFGHVDLAKTHDACGFCVGHVVGSKQVMKGIGEDKHYETRPIIRIDLALQIVAPTHGEIQISSVRGVFYKLRKLGMQFGKITYDSWGSDESIQTLNAEGFTAERFSVDTSTEPYQQAQEALYDDRVLCCRNPVLGMELATLMIDLKADKVDHPPRGSKDVADCFAAVISHCEKGFMGGATSQWSDVMTLSAVPRTSGVDDQDELWDKIARGIPLSEEDINRIESSKWESYSFPLQRRS